MTGHITRYDLMPIPPVPEHTEYFEAGVVGFGVEYRLLNDAIAAASEVVTETAHSGPLFKAACSTACSSTAGPRTCADDI